MSLIYFQKSPDDFDDDDFRKSIARYSKENFPNILKLADGLKEIGKKYDATAGQIALAWVLAQGDDFIPIPGTTKLPVCPLLRSVRNGSLTELISILQNLKHNVDAGRIKLSPEDSQAVRDVANKANASQGNRYPEAYMETLYADTPLP